MQFYNVPYFSAWVAHKNFTVLVMKSHFVTVWFPTHFEACDIRAEIFIHALFWVGMWFLLRITYAMMFVFSLTSYKVWGRKFIQCNNYALNLFKSFVLCFVSIKGNKISVYLIFVWIFVDDVNFIIHWCEYIWVCCPFHKVQNNYACDS